MEASNYLLELFYLLHAAINVPLPFEVLRSGGVAAWSPPFQRLLESRVGASWPCRRLCGSLQLQLHPRVGWCGNCSLTPQNGARPCGFSAVSIIAPLPWLRRCCHPHGCGVVVPMEGKLKRPLWELLPLTVPVGLTPTSSPRKSCRPVAVSVLPGVAFVGICSPLLLIFGLPPS